MQLQVLGTKAQTPKGLLGSWQSIPKQQGIEVHVVAEQHLHSKHSWNGASRRRCISSWSWGGAFNTSINSLYSVVPTGCNVPAGWFGIGWYLSAWDPAAAHHVFNGELLNWKLKSFDHQKKKERKLYRKISYLPIAGVMANRAVKIRKGNSFMGFSLFVSSSMSTKQTCRHNRASQRDRRERERERVVGE